MDWLLKWLAKRGLEWWIANRPFSKEKREARKERRRRKKLGLPPLEETNVDKLIQIIAGLRTSTKAGVAGLAPLVVLVPFYEQVNDFLMRACMSEEGPTVFLVGGAVVWVTMLVTARFSKTPDNPGKL